MEARTRRCSRIGRRSPVPEASSPARRPRSVRPAHLGPQTPRPCVTAAMSPALAYRGLARLGRGAARRLRVPPHATPGQRLDFVERRLGTDSFLLMPRPSGTRWPGSPHWHWPAGCSGATPRPEEMADRAARTPAQRDHRDGPGAVVFHPADPRGPAVGGGVPRGVGARARPGFREGRLPAVVQRGLAEFLGAYGHRAVAEIDLGMPRWSEQPEHLLGAIANYLRLTTPRSRRTASSPAERRRPSRRSRADAACVRARAAPRPSGARCAPAHPPVGRSAGVAEVLAGPEPRCPPPAARAGRGGSGVDRSDRCARRHLLAGPSGGPPGPERRDLRGRGPRAPCSVRAGTAAASHPP